MLSKRDIQSIIKAAGYRWLKAKQVLTSRDPEYRTKLDNVKAITRQFGLNYWPEEGYLTHTLHTLVIDRQGRLAADFEGNQFTARQLGDYVEALMSGK
jgi:hypothetical protein